METQLKASGKKQATILFAELTGINELSEKIEIDALSGVLNHCFEIITSVVDLYGGDINKLMGDSAFISFGITNSAIKNAAFKAVSVGTEIRARITEFNDDNNFAHPVGIKVGIKSGLVITGKIGSKDNTENTLMGETVNLVSRICDIAETNQVLTDNETCEKTKDHFIYQVLEPVPVKGLREPLAIFEVKGRNSSLSKKDIDSSRMINSAMVGREKEFRLLEKQFMHLINGRGSVVNIIGRAGIGKSRLMAEIAQNDLLQRVAVFEGRALSNGTSLSFLPIIQIIKSWAGITENESITDSLTKLQKGIRRVYPEAFDEIFPFIATMMGYSLDGKARGRVEGIEGEALENLILKNLRDLLSKAASLRPVVIVIEDAHWCDNSSIIFLESLFKITQKHRILFVNVFRPGHSETGERIQEFLKANLKDHQLEINIEALTQEQSDELINNLLDKTELPKEINSLILQRAGGSPFFIEEVIRSFIDEGLIEIKDKNFILTENIKYANIPETIDNVLLSRIDRLDDKTKNLLRTASVIGRNFYYKVLEEAAETIEEMDNKLEYLLDVQLINERKQKDEVEFLFKHALAQQATYDSIVENSKKDLHLKIAKSIEKVFAGRIHEFYGMLAHHYSKAGQQDKTEEYLIKAGDESMKSGASSEAVSFLKRGLEIYLQNKPLPDPHEVVNLEEKLAFAYYASGQYLEAVEYFEKVQAFYMKPFPKSGFCIAIDFIYHIFLIFKIMYIYNKPRYNAGTIEKKLMYIYQTKGHALATIDPKRLFIETFYGLRLMKKNRWGNLAASDLLGVSSMLFYVGIAIRFGKKLMDFAVQYLDNEFVIGTINRIFTLSMYLFFSGEKFEKLEEGKLFNKSIQYGEYWKLSTFYVYNGYSAIESGNEKIVKYYLQRLITISETFDNRFPEIQYHRVKTAMYVKFRKMDKVMKVMDEALSFAGKTEYKMQLLLYLCLQSMAFSILHEPDNARKSLAEASILLKDFRITLSYVQYLIAKSYIEIAELKIKPLNQSKGKLALKTTKDLINKSQKVKKYLPEAYRLRAIIFSCKNSPKKALLNFDKSIKSAQSFDGKLELSRTYFELGKFLRDPNTKKERLNGLNGTECLMKAKSMFEEMNLEWDLNEYEKYMEEGIN